MSDKKEKSPRNSVPAKPGTPWKLTERVLVCRHLERVLIYGPPGVGKTWAAYTLGDVSHGVYACTLSQEMPGCELRGNFHPVGDRFVWQDGPVVRAMREGARLVLNEISKASDDALTFLYPILEHAATARLTLPSNETVVPAPGFRVVATDNEAPEALPEALRDRFDARLEIREPHAAALAQLSPLIREVALRGLTLEAERRVSLRSWIVLERVRAELGLEDACCAVFGPERGAQIHDALLLAAAGKKGKS
jgi:MoxR-like ATPase